MAGEEILTIEQYLKCIAEILNKKEVKTCWVSPKVIAALLPSYSLPAFYEQVRLIPNIDKIKEGFGYQPISIQQLMKKTVEFFRNETEDSFGYAARNLDQGVVRLYE